MYYDPLARPNVSAWLDDPGSPPGVISNLGAPSTTGDRIIFMNLFTTSLMAIFVMARMYTKYFITKDVSWDDYTCLIAAAFGMTHIAGTTGMAYHGIGKHLWDISELDATKLKFWAWFAVVLYSIGILFAKISILCLYLKLFHPNKIFRYTVWTLMAIVVIQCSFSFWMNVFLCKDPTAAWMLYSVKSKCMDPWAVNIPIAASNIITDLIIYVIPIPLVWKLQLTQRQRSGIIGIFLLGALGSVFSCLRLWSFVIWDEYDWTWRFKSQSVWLWCICELNTFIICGCLAVLKPLLVKLIPRRGLAKLRSSSSKTSPTSSSSFLSSPKNTLRTFFHSNTSTNTNNSSPNHHGYASSNSFSQSDDSTYNDASIEKPKTTTAAYMV